MSEAKVQITLGTRADVSGINSLNKSLKRFGNDNRDAIGGLTLSVKALASSIDGPLAGAVGGMSSILSELVRGGVWGVLGSVANLVVGKIVDLWKEAKARAEEYANFMRAQVVESLAGVEAGVKSLAAAIADADKDVDAFVAAANGSITAKAKYDVARLHVEALQQVTDGMTDAAKGVIAANEAYEAGMVKARAEVDLALTACQAYRKRQDEIRGQVSAAEENLAAAVAEQARLEEMNHGMVVEHGVLVSKANRTVEGMVEAGWSMRAAIEAQTKSVHALNEFEKSHKDRLEQMKKATEAVATARDAVASALKAQEEVGKKVERAGEREALARAMLEAADLELAEKQRVASAVRQKEIDAAAAKAEAEEISALESERQLEWQERIYKKIKSDTELRGELINRLNELMEDGCEDEEIAHELNEKMREVRERRLKAEEDMAKDAEGEGEGKKGKPPSGGTTVSFDMGRLGDTVEKKMSFKDWQKKLREEQRRGRDERNNTRIDQAKMTKALKGEMPKAEAQAWMDYARQKYTPDQMRELGKLAMNSELLSKAEQKRQLKRIEQMATTLERALAVR